MNFISKDWGIGHAGTITIVFFVVFFSVVAISLLLLMYIKYRLKQRELEQKEVYAMVEKIVGE